MKKLILIFILLFSINTIAQYRYGYKDPADYVYLSGSFDVNMAFGIKDNKDTVAIDRGFDWDIELGARDRHVGVYMFYGEFRKFNYQTYGVGTDYYIHWLRGKKIGKITDGIDLSIGTYTSFILRRDYGSIWAPINLRTQVIIWNGDIGLILIAKGQDRPELNKIKFEGSIGIIIEFDRN